MKKLFAVLLLAIVSGQSFASEVITVSRREMGKDLWPLTRGEIMLSCEKNGGLFAINDSTLMQYPLNALPLAVQLYLRVCLCCRRLFLAKNTLGVGCGLRCGDNRSDAWLPYTRIGLSQSHL